MKYRVVYRLAPVLIEITNVEADSLEAAIEKGRGLCLQKFSKPYRGMEAHLVDGEPRVVGVERLDAWKGLYEEQ